MKTLTLFLFSLLITNSCSKDLETTTIEYTATTRGFFEKITIQNQEVFVSKDRNEKGKGKATKISNADWKVLIALFSKVELDSLETYKDPTQKRFYDGAPIASMTVLHEEKEYKTMSFDHGFPPVEITEFINKVVELGEKK